MYGRRRANQYVIVREVNSEDFDEDVIKSSHTGVVLFYSANSAFLFTIVTWFVDCVTVIK